MILAFLTTGYFFWRKGREEHYPEDEIFDVYLISVFWGVLASRLGFIIIHFEHFSLQPLKWIDIFSTPGFIPFFGLIAAATVIYRQAKKKKWDAFEVLDFAAIAVAFGSAIVWLGGFFDGSSFGNPTTLPWGVTFPSVFDRRHPTEIYGFIIYLFVFAYLFWVEGRYRTFGWYRDKRHSAQSGFLFSVFAILYGIFGIIFAMLMPPTFVIQGYSFDILIRCAVLIYGAILLYTLSGRSLLKSFKK